MRQVQINHRRLQAAVAEVLLDQSQRNSGFQQMRRVAVPQRVRRNSLAEVDLLRDQFDRQHFQQRLHVLNLHLRQHRQQFADAGGLPLNDKQLIHSRVKQSATFRPRNYLAKHRHQSREQSKTLPVLQSPVRVVVGCSDTSSDYAWARQA